MAGKYEGVRKATETSIEIDFYYNGQRCKERLKLKPTAANLKAASRHREAILHAIATGTFDYGVTFPASKRAKQFSASNSLTIKDYLTQWLKHKKPTLKSSTGYGYERIIHNTLIPQFGAIALTELRKRHVMEWVRTLTTTNRTINNNLNPLRAALADAVEDELIEANPLASWQYRRQEAPRESDVDPFSQEEQAAILKVLDGQHKNLIQFAFWTGMRTSELVALEWGDVDWINGTVSVQRAKTQHAKTAELPKTKAGRRSVKLLTPAIEALRNQKAHTFLEGGVIFRNPYNGLPWKGDERVRAFWITALKKAGVRYRRPYQTRHTYASMCISSGENLSWLSAQLGHSSVMVTTQHYARFIPDSIPTAGNKAVQMFTNRQERNLDVKGKIK
jgi:integrase